MKITVLTLAAVMMLAGCTSTREEQEPQKEPEQAAPAKEAPEKETGPVVDASHVNQLKEVDGVQEIQNPENVMVLVNKEFALPSDYSPPDLVRPNVQYSFGDQDIEKSYMRKEAASALETLFKGAEEDGLYLFAVSGYRSYARQEEILAAGAAASSEEEALKSIAPPGMSEHQSGLAMDISSESNNFELNEAFEATEEGKWLKDHAHEYGFILRYPKGKEAVTQYIYEPWHFRYVGKETAAVLYKNGWTLEDYFKQAKPAE